MVFQGEVLLPRQQLKVVPEKQMGYYQLNSEEGKTVNEQAERG